MTKRSYLYTLTLLLPGFVTSSEAEDPPVLNQESPNVTISDSVTFTGDEANPVWEISLPTEVDSPIQVLEMENLDVDGDSFKVTGEIRVINLPDNVRGYVEMWTHVPDKVDGTEVAGSFFSRTMGEFGPMKVLTSQDTEFRPFLLPAMINDGSGRKPLGITLNIVLPGLKDAENVKVEIRNLRQWPSFQTSQATFPVAPQPESTSTSSPAISWGTLAIGLLSGLMIAFAFGKFRESRRNAELQRIRNVDLT